MNSSREVNLERGNKSHSVPTLSWELPASALVLSEVVLSPIGCKSITPSRTTRLRSVPIPERVFSRTSLNGCAPFWFSCYLKWPATLYVTILDKQEIAIAADGKRIVYRRGELSSVSMTTEKMTKLGPKLAFMCSGLVEITTAAVDIRPPEIGRTLYGGYARHNKGLRVLPKNELTHEFCPIEGSHACFWQS